MAEYERVKTQAPLHCIEDTKGAQSGSLYIETNFISNSVTQRSKEGFVFEG